MSANGTLIVYKGSARRVESEELETIKAPDPVGRWYPLSHFSVLRRVKDTLAEAGYEVKKEQLALSKLDARFFGVLDLGNALSEGVTLSVGVRNSVDRSLPLGFAAGSRVLVCENLAFSAELLVKRKHTKFGEQRFANDIAASIIKLSQFKDDETKRIAAMKACEVSADRADSLILAAFEKGIITTPALPRVIKEWREPAHEEFKDRTYWSLMNAFTSALGERAKLNPHSYAVTTMRLSKHLAPPTLAV